MIHTGTVPGGAISRGSDGRVRGALTLPERFAQHLMGKDLFGCVEWKGLNEEKLGGSGVVGGGW